MKSKIILLSGILLLVFFNAVAQESEEKSRIDLKKSEAADSVEYELIVFDTGFETYLLMHPMHLNSESYYQAWNTRYVMEWNSRYNNQIRYRESYDSFIDYRPEIDYGEELNWKLYSYFRYFEESNGVKLIRRR